MNVFLVDSIEEGYKRIQEYENETFCKFCVRTVRSKDFGNAELYSKKGNSCILWFDTLPYIYVNQRIFDCKYGPDRHISFKAKLDRKNEETSRSDHTQGTETKRLVQRSRKLGCPAQISLKEIFTFPECTVPTNNRYSRIKASREIRASLGKKEIKAIKKFILTFPSCKTTKSTFDLHKKSCGTNDNIASILNEAKCNSHSCVCGKTSMARSTYHKHKKFCETAQKMKKDNDRKNFICFEDGCSFTSAYQADFLAHLKDIHFIECAEEVKVFQNYADVSQNQAYIDLRVIAEDIKTMIPVEAILPSENVDHSQMENNSTDRIPTLHVDSFLYEEEHIDELETQGKIKRHYCKNCGSTDIAPITFISHSASIKRSEYIFKKILPDLTGKVILDVGSRLGAVLYGAYYYSSAQKIIGVEMNADFCRLQKHIINKYGLGDRIEIVCNNICNIPETIESANVIILNNVFQCFMPKDMQQKIWQWLRSTITVPGTLLVTVPSVEDTFSKLQIAIDVSSWLRKNSVEHNDMEDEDCMDDPDLITEICYYTVL